MSTFLSNYIEDVLDNQSRRPIPITDFERTVLREGKVYFVFKAIGNKALNGFSNQYEIHYPEDLKSFDVQQEDLVKILTRINKIAIENWPCLNCFYCGLGLSLLTCCISYLIPHLCISDSESYVREEISQSNKEYFFPRGLELKLMKNCISSWLQINILSHEDKLQAMKCEEQSTEVQQTSNFDLTSTMTSEFSMPSPLKQI